MDRALYVDGTALLAYLRRRADPLVHGGRRDQNRQNLSHWLARYCELRDAEAVLVFDGNGPEEVLSPSERVGRVKVVNVPYGGAARDEMARPANKAAADRRTLVVTADWRLAEALARGKARVLDPERFMAQARKAMGVGDEAAPGEPDRKYTGVADEQVDYWMQYFGLDE